MTSNPSEMVNRHYKMVPHMTIMWKSNVWLMVSMVALSLLHGSSMVENGRGSWLLLPATGSLHRTIRICKPLTKTTHKNDTCSCISTKQALASNERSISEDL